jgi:hypothetical protein
MDPLLDTPSLTAAWILRRDDLRSKRLQPYNDLLFIFLRDLFRERRASVQNGFREIIRQAARPSHLVFSIWSYKTTVFNQPPTDPEVLRQMRDTGSEWYIGTRLPTTPITYKWFEDNEPARVHDVVRRTDLLTRLCLLFGDSYHIDFQVIDSQPFPGSVDGEVLTYELRLHFFPLGLPEHLKARQETTSKFYEDHRSLVSEHWRPYVWTMRPLDIPPPIRRMHESPLEEDGLSTVLSEPFSEPNTSPCYCNSCYHEA